MQRTPRTSDMIESKRGNKNTLTSFTRVQNTFSKRKVASHHCQKTGRQIFPANTSSLSLSILWKLSKLVTASLYPGSPKTKRRDLRRSMSTSSSSLHGSNSMLRGRGIQLDAPLFDPCINSGNNMPMARTATPLLITLRHTEASFS